MKRILVNDNCIGCGACVAIDPKHFDFDENGLSNAISQEDIDTEEVKNAMASCPVNAIGYDECACKEKCECNGKCECTEEDCNCGK